MISISSSQPGYHRAQDQGRNTKAVLEYWYISEETRQLLAALCSHTHCWFKSAVPAPCTAFLLLTSQLTNLGFGGDCDCGEGRRKQTEVNTEQEIGGWHCLWDSSHDTPNRHTHPVSKQLRFFKNKIKLFLLSIY